MLRGQLSFAMICCEAASLPHDVLGTIRSIQFERWYLHASSYVSKTTIWWVRLQWLCTLQLIFTIIIITADKPLRIKFCYHSYSEAAIAMKTHCGIVMVQKSHQKLYQRRPGQQCLKHMVLITDILGYDFQYKQEWTVEALATICGCKI